jgi:catechol 2,3-dioxygenase-like lactoylglutathione lyase family enzyme
MPATSDGVVFIAQGYNLRAAMKIRYRHTSIVARDWRALADFYVLALGCAVLPPERDLSGAWLDRGTGVADAHLCGAHLRLPGHGDDGPTLEIFTYERMRPRPPTAADREGIAHLAFEVDDVEACERRILACGGRRVGAVSSHEVPGVRRLTFVYLADPEGNIIELQSWG